MKRSDVVGWMVRMLVVAVVGSAPATASSSAAEPDCFDALVYASIVRQTPTVIPDCGDDCIIMRWPWIVELDVNRVIRGKISSYPLTVMTVQHTYYRTDLGARRWWLRRNSLGMFNVLEPDEETRLAQCSRSASPAKPYIQPSEGRTLQDLVREGEEYYGKHP